MNSTKHSLMVKITRDIKKHASYLCNKEKIPLKIIKIDSVLLEEIIPYYQSAFELFRGGKIKIK